MARRARLRAVALTAEILVVNLTAFPIIKKQVLDNFGQNGVNGFEPLDGSGSGSFEFDCKTIKANLLRNRDAKP